MFWKIKYEIVTWENKRGNGKVFAFGGSIEDLFEARDHEFKLKFISMHVCFPLPITSFV